MGRSHCNRTLDARKRKFDYWIWNVEYWASGTIHISTGTVPLVLPVVYFCEQVAAQRFCGNVDIASGTSGTNGGNINLRSGGTNIGGRAGSMILNSGVVPLMPLVI